MFKKLSDLTHINLFIVSVAQTSHITKVKATLNFKYLYKPLRQQPTSHIKFNKKSIK